VLPRLHIVTDDAVLAGHRFLPEVEGLLDRGGPGVALHVRGPRTSGKVLYERAIACARIARRTASLLIVNGRVDVALACEADGVQLGRDALPLSDARRILGSERLVGASVHAAPEAWEAARQGADFLLAGTLFESRSHPGRPPSGLGWLQDLNWPGKRVFGIGGITPETVASVVGAGAHGVAVISGIWAAPSPLVALDEYLSELERND
jgi:thiamine-phosphate diphosphorylase